MDFKVFSHKEKNQWHREPVFRICTGSIVFGPPGSGSIIIGLYFFGILKAIIKEYDPFP